MADRASAVEVVVHGGEKILLRLLRGLDERVGGRRRYTGDITESIEILADLPTDGYETLISFARVLETLPGKLAL